MQNALCPDYLSQLVRGEIETNLYYLLECNQYNELRQAMLDEMSRYCLPSLHTFLYGSNALSDQDNDLIFKAIQRYIVRTKRFGTSQYIYIH